MDSYIIGKIKRVKYLSAATSFMIASFLVQETTDPKMEIFLNKEITITGNIPDYKLNTKYKLFGTLTMHAKYSWQYNFNKFEVMLPTNIEEIEIFLASEFVKGCSKLMAKKIVEKYKEKSLDIIKESYNNLLSIKGMTIKKALSIYECVNSFDRQKSSIDGLIHLGFSTEDAYKIINTHYNRIDEILDGNLYILKDIFDFKKIDEIYKANFDINSFLRISECLYETINIMTYSIGSTYFYEDELYKGLSVYFGITLDSLEFNNYLIDLCKKGLLFNSNEKYYLKDIYVNELSIAAYLKSFSKENDTKFKRLDEKISSLEETFKIKYNDEQKCAIKSALNNDVSIISGGPGTGKTTIIRAICSLLIAEYNMQGDEIASQIALLAPTGRASKRLALATGYASSTIHRFLKWHKEENYFEYDETNKVNQKFFIIDEASMLDVNLFAALLCAMRENSKIILVGDIYQLPSVGPGLVLSNIISSDYFPFTKLEFIYRQSENSYIPFLAKDIKMQNVLDDDFMYKRDDYSFISSPDDSIIPNILSCVKMAYNKGIDENKLQILSPVYKGLNGIDNLNEKLQDFYNPKDKEKEEVSFGTKKYRENDKVLQLVNDADNNVYNGDIGKIESIYKDISGKDKIKINFDGEIVIYEKKDLKNITHAYAISVHKAQGSEFENVIIPICKNFYLMLYNKLIYTAVSRAKKSLVIVGDPKMFISSIYNNYTSDRKTSLLEFLNREFNK